MARFIKEKRISIILLVVFVGLLIGGLLTQLVSLLPGGEHNVVRNIFTTSIPLRLGSFEDGSLKSWLFDIGAMQIQFAFQLKINILSIAGLAASVTIFSKYK
ncbi:MAG: hypothetical protein ACQEQ4_01395 [Fibrobacterota bacterium]|jgi:hypothetical protein